MAASGESGSRNIVVTGGTGYIGSHTVVLLVEAGWNVTIIDNLSNSNTGVLSRIGEVTGKPEAVEFVECDLKDRAALDRVFSSKKYAAVIHFAGYKAVGESRRKPLMYYDNNLIGTITLLEAMAAVDCKTILFSSSCTVYGTSPPPLTEKSAVGNGLTNAYARTKYFIEEMLRDLYDADSSWSVCLLRYFNPVGAHDSGKLGEDPRDIPNCLMPYVLQVLVGRLDKLTVFGDDYPTRDGTPIRDYIHVMDVARGHLSALDWVQKEATREGHGVLEAFNFGTGKGTTVFELVHALEKASGRKVPYEVGPRREGDLSETFCDPSKAEKVLGWRAGLDLSRMCVDAWRWQSTNPEGYK